MLMQVNDRALRYKASHENRVLLYSIIRPGIL